MGVARKFMMIACEVGLGMIIWFDLSAEKMLIILPIDYLIWLIIGEKIERINRQFS